MRQVTISVLAPFAALAAIGLAITYPGPTELWAGIQPVNQEIRVVDAGGTHASSVVQDITASHLPEPAKQQPVANRDCFQDLALADQAKLDRCSRVVYQALIEVEKANRVPVITTLATASNNRLVERLKYAATEVCRSSWAKQPVNKPNLDSPACEAAQIEIASGAP
jgi:hypothetical protein